MSDLIFHAKVTEDITVTVERLIDGAVVDLRVASPNPMVRSFSVTVAEDLSTTLADAVRAAKAGWPDE